MEQPDLEKMRDLESRKIIIENLNKMEIDNLIVIGGNGSLKGAELLKNESELQVSVIPGLLITISPIPIIHLASIAP